MTMLSIEQSRDLSVRLAGATHSLRVYGMKGESWERIVEGLHGLLVNLLSQMEAREITIALLGDNLAVCGTPLYSPPDSVLRFMGQLKERNIEIISFLPGIFASETESLLALLGTDSAELAGTDAEQWLRARGVNHIRVKHISVSSYEKTKTFRDVIRRGVGVLSQEFRQIYGRGTVNEGVISDLAKNLTDLVLHSELPVSLLLSMRDRDDYTMVHSVNVGVLASYQASSLGMPEDKVLEASIAGLMHDVGKARVPEAILQKTTPLTAAEKKLLDMHTVEGARLLMETNGLTGIIPLVAFSHHQPYSEKSMLTTELVRIADIFDSIRTLRPFEDEKILREALGYMIVQFGGKLNLYLLERFATMCGLIRRGDMGKLATGEVVRVLQVHNELALRPTVEIIEEGKGGGKQRMVLDLLNPPSGVQSSLLIPQISSHFSTLDPAEVELLG